MRPAKPSMRCCHLCLCRRTVFVSIEHIENSLTSFHVNHNCTIGIGPPGAVITHTEIESLWSSNGHQPLRSPCLVLRNNGNGFNTPRQLSRFPITDSFIPIWQSLWAAGGFVL